MTERWVDNDVWEHHELHNRAPRAGIYHCQRIPWWQRHAAVLIAVGLTSAFWAGLILGVLTDKHAL